MAADGGEMCEMKELPTTSSAATSFNFAEFDFLDFLTETTSMPSQPIATPVLRRETTPYKTTAEPLTTMTIGDPTTATTTKKKARTLARRIASVDELARKLRLRDTECAQLSAQLHDFQRIAGEIQTLYEDEKRMHQQLAAEHKRLKKECTRIDADLAHRTLQYDQLQAQWDEFSGGPLEYGALAVHYLKLTQKLDEAKLLHWSEQALVKDMQKYCKQRALSVPQPPPTKSPVKKRKSVHKSEKSVQCELWQQEPSPPAPPTKPQTRDQFTQHISTTTTRSTSTACFIKRRDVAINFPERAPLPPLKQMLQELKKWNCIEPVGPLTDLPPLVETPLSTVPSASQTPHTPLVPLHTLKTKGTCTLLCNIQRQIDFLPPTPVHPIKRSVSRPPSRLAFDVCGVKHELSTTPPPLASPTATAPPPLLPPPSATSSNTPPHTSTPTTSRFLPYSSPSALSHLSPAAFEQLWQVFGQMLLGLLQPRNSATVSTSDALSQQEFHNWMRSLYDNMQQQQQEQPQPQAEVSESIAFDVSPATQSLDTTLHRPPAQCSDNFDNGSQTPTLADHYSSPHHQSIGTSPIHFHQPEVVHLEDHESMANQQNTFLSDGNANLTAASPHIPCIRLPQQKTEFASAFQPHANSSSQMPPPPAPPTNFSRKNVSNKILNFFSDGNNSKEQRKAIKKRHKRSKRKPKREKTKTPTKLKKEPESYAAPIAPADAKDRETAVDFLATLSCFKSETAGDNIAVTKFDEAAEELETPMQENNLNLNTQNDVLKKHETDFSTIPKDDTLEERQRALRDIEHSLFGSDTDMESSADEDEPQQLVAEEAQKPQLSNLEDEAVDEICGEVSENTLNCAEIEYNKIKSEKSETETLRKCQQLESLKYDFEIPTADEEQPLQSGEMHAASADNKTMYNVASGENKTELSEPLLALMEEQTSEISTDIVESYGELRCNNETDIFRGAEEFTNDLDLVMNEEKPKEILEECKNSIIEISSDLSNLATTAAAELDDRSHDELIINEESEEIDEESGNSIIELSSEVQSAVYNTATNGLRTLELADGNHKASTKILQASNEVANITNTAEDVPSVALIMSDAIECPLVKSCSPNKHAATLTNSSNSTNDSEAKDCNKLRECALVKTCSPSPSTSTHPTNDSEAKDCNEYMPNETKILESKISDIEISSETKSAPHKRTKQSESTQQATKKFCKSVGNVITKMDTIVNTEILTSPVQRNLRSTKFTAISPIKDNRAVASMLQNNENKIEEDAFSNSEDLCELGDETASISALIDTNLLNELLTDSTTSLVVNEMLNETEEVATSASPNPSPSNGNFNFANAVSELEAARKLGAQITPKKRGRKRKIETSPTATASNGNAVVICKRSARLRAKQIIINSSTESFLTPVVLGKYTNRRNIPTNEQKNSTSKCESLELKNANDKTDLSADDEDDLSLKINLGFFKERLSDETTKPTPTQLAKTTKPTTMQPRATTTTAAATSITNKNCDILLAQQKQADDKQPRMPSKDWSGSFAAAQSLHATRRRLTTPPNDDELFHSFQRKVKTAQTVAIVEMPTSYADAKLPTPTTDFPQKDAETEVVTASTAASHIVDALSDTADDPASPTPTDFVAYDDSPASPSPNSDTAEAVDTASLLFPKEIPLELDAKYKTSRGKNNSLLKRLVSVYSNDEHVAINQEQNEQRNKIETQLRQHIQQFLFLHDKNTTTATAPTTATPIEVEAAQLVRQLLQITSDGNYEAINASIIAEMREVARPEEELNCALNELPPFALSSAHQRIAYVMRHLQYQRSSYANELMTALEAALFNKKTVDQLKFATALNLTQLYLLAAGQLSLAANNPARLFIAKCLYFHKLKAWPMIYEVLCRFPTVLPHRDDRTYDRSDALITVIQHTLMCNKYEMERMDLRPKELLSKLRFEYHFEPFKPERSEVLTNLIEKLKAGRLTHLKYAFALLCKRLRPPQVERDVLQQHLVPLANEYYTRVQQSCAHDAAAAALLDCISMLVKPFPIEDANVSAYLDLFARFLNVVDRASIQEAAVQSVLRMQRFGVMNCYNVLVDFAPSYELQPITKAALKTFVHRRPLKFWRDCSAQARIGAEHES